MILSRKWLNEFVQVDENDRDFAEAMTLSGSKVEVTENPGAEIVNVVVGKVTSIVPHTNSDHMYVTKIDVGTGKDIQIVTGAWNVHAGDFVPVCLDNSMLPGGKKINTTDFRGELSEGMLCSLKELELDEHDFPYGVIKPAALLNNYKPIDPEKPSISSDIKAGDKVFGSVICAKVVSVATTGYTFDVVICDGEKEVSLNTPFNNIHEDVLVAYDTKKNVILGLDDLHAEQREFPNCIPDGIWIIHEDDAVPGMDIKEITGKNDSIVEFEITPNRPDCLCMIGLAREAAVTFNKPLNLHTPVIKAEAGGDVNDLAKVIIEEPDLCVRYTAKMVKNVKIAPSPRWLRERIRAGGMRPINNIVDITNYVMMEYGQPMHAFDFACVEGNEIHVRKAKEGETIQTLDGNERPLSTNMLCICDVNKPIGLAGVMGGANSEIIGDTAMVLFESANFDGTSIRRTAAALNMRTDASAKYEKGLDPANTIKAIERACELVEMLGAGEVVGGTIDVLPKPLNTVTLKLEPEKINNLLGTEIDRPFMEKTLLDLGFGLDGDTISVPSWRSDVEHYSDIAEEVARFYGYNNIPDTFSGGNTQAGGYTELQQHRILVGEVCRSLGMDEIITYSFISPTYYDKIRLPENSPLRDSLKILNPLGEDTSIMRTTVLPSMLEIITRNYNYRNAKAKLYEVGKVYFKRKEDKLADEPEMISIGTYGEGANFYQIKGWVEALLNAFRTAEARYEPCTNNPSYHPGRCANVYIGNTYIGVFGQIHPLVAANYGVDAEIYCAELSFNNLYSVRGGLPVYKALPRYPSTTRDLAIVCDDAITVGQLVECIKNAGGENLREVELFDIYKGEHIAEGKKSVAFSLTMRADDQTMTDEAAESIINAVLADLKSVHNAVIR